jgi:predicted NACHT family NTPase
MPDPQQNQNIDRAQITDSQVQQTQADRDALSLQNSHHNQITITNVVTQLFAPKPAAEIDWQWATRILKERQQPEISQRLQDALIQEQQAIIDLEEQPQRIGRSPLQPIKTLQIPNQPSQDLPADQLLIEIFGRKDIGGKLLILGAPGAGKTTLLLGLAEQLVAGALDNPRTVIPIIFELSEWKDDNQTIADWLVAQLEDKFGGGRIKTYRRWLTDQVLLPLLDGLDELGMVRQRKCMEKLNQFAAQYSQLVVCCRVQEFEQAGASLDHLRGAVCLQALSDRQIATYLTHIHKPALWEALQTDASLKQLLEPLPDEPVGLLRVPLFLSIAASVYEPDRPFLTKADLLEQYIDHQLSPEKRRSDRRRFLTPQKPNQNAKTGRAWAYKTLEQEPDWRHTRHYLSWLAQQLQQHHQTELLIEQMQPSWLDTKQQKWQYRFMFRLLFRLFCGLFLGVSFGLIGGFIIGLITINILNLFLPVNILVAAFFLTWFISWLTIEFSLDLLIDSLDLLIDRDKIYPVEMFKTSKVRLVKAEIWWGYLAVHLGLFLGLLFKQSDFTTYNSLFFIAFLILISGLIFILKDDLEDKRSPNQGIQESFKNIWIITLFSYPLTCVGLLGSFIVEGHSSIWQSIAIAGVIVSFLIGMYLGGGIACTKHLALRIILCFSANSIPWNYSRFLNYGAERRLLHRVGGRYRFLHRELLDHFAALR